MKKRTQTIKVILLELAIAVGIGLLMLFLILNFFNGYQTVRAGKLLLTGCQNLSMNDFYENYLNQVEVDQKITACRLSIEELETHLRKMEKSLVFVSKDYFTNWYLLLDSADSGLVNLQKIIRFFNPGEDVVVQALSNAENPEFIKEINDLAVDASNLATALSYPAQPFSYIRDKYSVEMKKLNQLSDQLSDFENNVIVANWLLGYQASRHYLVFFQNTSELRPTGGFWGSYGILTLDKGRLTRWEVDDIYHLDDLVIKNTEPLLPPKPLDDYLSVEQWFIRDINWSPDFPTSASLAETMFKQVRPEEDISAVMAITPDLIGHLLDIYGPIEVENKLLTSENFLSETQYEVSLGYREKGIPAWERKEFLQHLADALLNKIEQNQTALLSPALIPVWTKSASQKNILIYSQDKKIQNILETKNWAGHLLDPGQSDYFMVVDVNLASLKTDPTIDRRLSYELEKTAKGYLVNLTATYIHNGQFDWRTSRYNNYQRLYVPFGSKLEAAKIIYKNEVIDITNEIKIAQENEKTVFERFISIEPQETKAIKYIYYLPDNLASQLDKEFKLLIQKQPGANNQKVSLTINLPNIDQDKLIFSNDYQLNRSGQFLAGFDFIKDEILTIKN